jgi:hypothetical protein
MTVAMMMRRAELFSISAASCDMRLAESVLRLRRGHA